MRIILFRFFLLFMLLCGARATAQFPDEVATREDIPQSFPLCSTTLSTPGINNSTLTLPVVNTDCFDFASPGSTVVRVDNEFIKLCGKDTDPTRLLVCTGGRGFEGTGEASHATGARVAVTYTSEYHEALARELIAMQEALGAGLSNVLGGLITITGPQPGDALFYDGDLGKLVNRLMQESDLPAETLTESRNDVDRGTGTQASITECFKLAASGEICLRFSDGLVEVLGQLQPQSIVVPGTGFPQPTGFLQSRLIPLFDQFDEDLPNLGVWPGPHACEILKLGCKTTGAGSETVTATLTRNGNDITEAALVCDNGRQTSCGTAYGTEFGSCDVDNLDDGELLLEPDDVIGFNYTSQANSPTSLSFFFTCREVAVP